jgi:hypothetical protein
MCKPTDVGGCFWAHVASSSVDQHALDAFALVCFERRGWGAPDPSHTAPMLQSSTPRAWVAAEAGHPGALTQFKRKILAPPLYIPCWVAFSDAVGAAVQALAYECTMARTRAVRLRRPAGMDQQQPAAPGPVACSAGEPANAASPRRLVSLRLHCQAAFSGWVRTSTRCFSSVNCLFEILTDIYPQHDVTESARKAGGGRLCCSPTSFNWHAQPDRLRTLDDPGCLIPRVRNTSVQRRAAAARTATAAFP